MECIIDNLIGHKNEIIKILDTKEDRERRNEDRCDKQKTDSYGMNPNVSVNTVNTLNRLSTQIKR